MGNAAIEQKERFNGEFSRSISCNKMKKKRTGNKKGGSRQSMPFIGVSWECCKAYSRVYLNKKRTAYVGWCPKCGKRVQLDLSPTGSKSRFFNVG